MNISVRTSHLIVAGVSALLLTVGSAGAGAYAGARWIDGHTIKPHSIPSNRIQPGISGKQLAKKTVTRRALADATVDDLTQTVVYVNHTYQVEAREHRVVAVTCPDGTQVTGGYLLPGGSAFAAFVNSYVDPDKNALMVELNSSYTPGEVTVQTICLR